MFYKVRQLVVLVFVWEHSGVPVWLEVAQKKGWSSSRYSGKIPIDLSGDFAWVITVRCAHILGTNSPSPISMGEEC